MDPDVLGFRDSEILTTILAFETRILTFWFQELDPHIWDFRIRILAFFALNRSRSFRSWLPGSGFSYFGLSGSGSSQYRLLESSHTWLLGSGSLHSWLRGSDLYILDFRHLDPNMLCFRNSDPNIYLLPELA